MKKTFTIYASLIGVFLLVAMPVLAATTISLSPVSVNVKQGQSFNVAVYVNPQGVSNYTIKAQLSFPKDLVEVTSFSFASGWMALTQSGYDSIDNNSGGLIKSAGYPGGFSSNMQFGTVRFKAKKSGSGVIKSENGSLTLDASSQNVFSAAGNQTTVQVVAVTSASPSPTPSPVSTPTPTASPTPTGSVNPTPTGAVTSSTSSEPTLIASPAPSPTSTPIIPSVATPVSINNAFAAMAGLAATNGLYGAAIAILLVLAIYLAVRIIGWRKNKIS